MEKTHLNLLEGVGDHSYKHVEKYNDYYQCEYAIKDSTNKLGKDVFWHVHIVLIGHSKHGPKQEVYSFIKSENKNMTMNAYGFLEVSYCERPKIKRMSLKTEQ